MIFSEKTGKNLKTPLTNAPDCGIILSVENISTNADMAELADALDSGSSEGNFMQVQFLLPAPKALFTQGFFFLFSRFVIMPI